MPKKRKTQLLCDPVPSLAPDANDSWRVFRMMAEFVEGFEAMLNLGPAVTIFGSARTQPDDPFYQAAVETARLLAKKKWAVITGGGPGIMEAGNKGAFDAGGKSVGLNIKLPHEQHGNKFQTLTLDFHYFYARKVMFVKYASAFICFPGGFGTLDEFFETLTLIQTAKSVPFPIILFGSKFWAGLVEWIESTLEPHFIAGEDMKIFRVVDTPEEAVKLIMSSRNKVWWKPRIKRPNQAVPDLGGNKGKPPMTVRSPSYPNGEEPEFDGTPV